MSVSNTPSEKKVFASEDKQANDNPLERTEIHNYYSNFAVIKSDNDSVTFVKRTTAEYGPSSSKPAMYLGKESQLHQHLRLASTRPVGFAVEEAQVQVEEATQVRGGLIKKDENGKEFLAKAAALDKDKAFKEEIDAAEVELGQLNKNMAKREDSLLKALYATYLRCPADPLHLVRYGPIADHTPAPAHLQTELRKATAAAARTASEEVFSQYIQDPVRLKQFMAEYVKITVDHEAFGMDEVKEAAKKISEARNALEKREEAAKKAKEAKEAEEKKAADAWKALKGASSR